MSRVTLPDRVAEAALEQHENGKRPAGDGWFVLNVADASWFHNAKFGTYCVFENREQPFPQLGINLHILEPGKPGCHYHRENQQEDFLVLHGECTLVIEEEERALKAWDFVHCPPGANHVFVGAGAGPCLVLMVGARLPEEALVYPVSEVAAKYGASAKEETTEPRVSYADSPRAQPCPARWPLQG